MEKQKEQHKKSIRFFNNCKVRAVLDEKTINGDSQYLISLLQSTNRTIIKRRETIRRSSKQS